MNRLNRDQVNSVTSARINSSRVR